MTGFLDACHTLVGRSTGNQFDLDSVRHLEIKIKFENFQNLADFSQNRSRPGFEPGTSRTLSGNHTPRPTRHGYLFILKSFDRRPLTDPSGLKLLLPFQLCQIKICRKTKKSRNHVFSVQLTAIKVGYLFNRD